MSVRGKRVKHNCSESLARSCTGGGGGGHSPVLILFGPGCCEGWKVFDPNACFNELSRSDL